MPDTRRSAALRWLPGTILLAALLVLALRAVEWERFSELIRDAEPVWLLVAVCLQLGTYVCAAAVLHRGVDRGHRGDPRGVRELMRAA
jgi:uncharacterized membrane protein YbhN (UPF0104 family)